VVVAWRDRGAGWFDDYLAFDCMMTLEQTDFKDTALPRWGCFWLSIGAGVADYIDVEPSYGTVLSLYKKTLKTPCRKWVEGEEQPGHVLEIDNMGHLNCTRPGVALRMWIKALGAVGEGDQVGDQDGFYPLVNDEWKESFRLRRYVTANNNGHWCMTYTNNRMVYNPDRSLVLKAKASKYYRRYYIDAVL